MIPLRNVRRFFRKTLKQPEYAFQVFIKRLKAYFYYWFGKGKSSFPEAITLFLTHRCNLHCKMCGQWGETGITKMQSTQHIKEELSLDELKRVIDDVSKFKSNITLFGGEPLLYPYCLDIIKYIKKKGMHCLMITNGSMLENLAEQVVENGLDELNVSIDGARQLHDGIRGMPGLFDKIINGLKQVNHFKVKRGRRKPFINLQCAITKYNYRHLEQMLDVAKETEADSLTFHNLIFLGKELIEKQKEYDRLLNCSSYDWEGFIFEPDVDPEILYFKIKEIMAESKRVVSFSHRFDIDFYPNFSYKRLKEYYKNPSYLPSKYPTRCLSPWMTAYLFPDGEVRPCLNFDYSYGNIRENKFIELWNNRRALRYRNTIRKNKIFPVCVRCTELYRY